MSAPSSPPHGVADGRSGVSSGASPEPSGTDGSGDLRALADVIEREGGCHCLVHVLGEGFTGRAADRVAEAVLAAGWRRVTEDPDREIEIRALEKALERSQVQARQARSEGLDRETCRFYQAMNSWLRRRIEALRAGEEPDWDDAFDSSAVLRGGAQ